MFNASSWLRRALALLIAALTLHFVPPLGAQTIDLSLNVFYTDPASAASGGTWELVGKSTNFGIAGLQVLLTNINSGTQIEGPRATVNGSNPAGFQLLADIPQAANPPTSAYRELVIAQIPIAPNSLPSGNEETLFYGVGTLSNGAPNYPGHPGNAIGPAFTSLTNPQDIPWATGDFFGNAVWDTAARMVSGTFAAGVTPSFLAGSSGNVFMSVPVNNTSIGAEAQATAVTTIVRTNLAPSADYNHNGIVDAADYVVWRNTLNQVVPPGTGASGDNSGVVDQGDYTLWRAHFGLPSGAGSGDSLSVNNVPEPTSAVLLIVGAMLALSRRRVRISGAVNS